MYHLDITKNWLDFGDLDLIFKVTAIVKLKIRKRGGGGGGGGGGVGWGDIHFLWKHSF